MFTEQQEKTCPIAFKLSVSLNSTVDTLYFLEVLNKNFKLFSAVLWHNTTFPCVNTLFCANKFAWLPDKWVHTLHIALLILKDILIILETLENQSLAMLETLQLM